MKYRHILQFMFIIGVLMFVPLSAQAQLPPPNLTPPGNVEQGTGVLITTEPNAECTIRYSDGTAEATITADGEGHIFIFVNNSPGTTLSIFCQVGNTTSPTVSITVIVPPPPTEDITPPTDVPPTEEPTPPPPLPQVCAFDSNAELREAPDHNAQRMLFLQPVGVAYNTSDQQVVNGETWYQLATNGYWVVATDVRTNNCSALVVDTIVPNTDLDLADILGDECPELIQMIIDTLPPDVIVDNSDSDTPCTTYQNLILTWGNEPDVVDPLSSDAGVTLFNSEACTGADAMVIPGFVDILDNLERDVREQVRAVLDRNDPCEFANNLIQGNWIRFDLLGGVDGIDPETALGLIIGSCEPYLDPTVVDGINDRFVDILGENYRTYFTTEVNDVCALVETLIFIGQLSAEQELLFDVFTETCGWENDHALEIVTYVTTIGGNTSIKNIVEDASSGDFCTIVESNLTLYVFDPDDLSPDDASTVQQIAGALDECASDDTDLLIMVMSAWNQWDDLDFLQEVALLTADNPCEAIVTWLTTGVAPTFPEDETPPPFPPPMPPDVVDTRLGNVDEEDIPEPDDPISPRARIISDIDATAIFIGHNGGTQRLYIITAGESLEIEVARGRNISNPVLNATGEWAAYLDLEANEIRNILLAANSDVPIITAETFADCALTLADYPIAWSPDDTRLLVTLRNAEDVLGIYSYHFYDNELDCDPLLLNAHSPAFRQEGRTILYVDISTASSDIGFHNLHSGYSGRYRLPARISASMNEGGLNIPVTACFSPAYHLGTDNSETSTFVFACQSGDDVLYFQREFIRGRSEIRQLDLRLEEFEAQGLIIDNIQNVVPGPAPDYVAFDDGIRVYFARMWDNDDLDLVENNPETGVLIQLPNHDVSMLRWVPAH